jgi:superfamily II DNA or RNA helicase
MVSYVQVVGRILRAHAGQDHVIIQDHGGSWWRHGSPNQDRDWAAYWSMPEHYATAVREERIRSKKEPEPIHCPKCQCIRSAGDTCPDCGYRHTNKSRMVIQHDGKMREMTGDIFKPRRVKREPNTQKIWEQCYYRTLHAKDRDNKTFREAVGLFVHEQHYWPPKDLDLMPTNEADWFRAIRDVPRSKLTGVPASESKREPEPSLFH